MFNFQPVKKVHFKFDPFHPNIGGIRGAMHAFSTQKVRATNHKCMVKFEVVSDGSEPTLKVDLNDALARKPILFKAGLLSDYEILFHFNSLILPLCTPEELIIRKKNKKKKNFRKKTEKKKWKKK